MADDSSDLSSLSSLSPAPSDAEDDLELKRDKGILKFFHKLPKGAKAREPVKEDSPPPAKRPASPPHEYVLADNPDISFIVMFRSRFNEAFPKSLANFGPQELERDVTEPVAGERVEHFLCALLSLLLNRKQDVKLGHFNRALEDAISTHKNQWPRDWGEKNPLSGGVTFATMSPTERLTLLRNLILWALSSSEVVKGIINKSYKHNRQEDDVNQPLSVPPWGSDSDKRRYFLIEGLDDTAFRVYRESNPAGYNRTWWCVAGNIEELRQLIDKLNTVDGGPKARKLAQKMEAAIPRFEATEEKRKRREYRLAHKERFKRPEPGFSVYEGRTRGKRMKYTYSDDEDFLSDSTSVRRSTRNTGTTTPAEPAGPVTTASGRQVKAPSRMTIDASNNIVTTTPERQNTRSVSKESSVGPSGRPRRSAAVNHGTNGWSSSRNQGRNSILDDDDDEDSSEPDLGDDEEDDHVPDESDEDEDEFDEDADMADVDDDLDDGPRSGSKMVILKVPSTKINFNKFRYDASKTKNETHVGERTGDSISVAPKKGLTPPPETDTSIKAAASITRPPPTPNASALQSTPLVYRQSPDKSQARPQARPQARA